MDMTVTPTRLRTSIATLAIAGAASAGISLATPSASAASRDVTVGSTSADSTTTQSLTPRARAAQQLGMCVWIGKPYGQKFSGKWHVVGQGGATCGNGLGVGRGFIEVTLQQKRAWGWDDRQKKTLWGAGTAHPKAKCRDFGWYTWRTVVSIYGRSGRNYSLEGRKTSPTWRTRC
ncbi:hypothetical protein [Microbispora sp. H10670]|uniref:hypothetical protein n=1 Tax=Microbispora sp. H10670 TaxID=2729108 RepID=UPI0015FF737A|nr:hypothetical protein [Microbispora sp. H10670]